MQQKLSSLEKSEVLRYLGYRGQTIPEDLERLIDDCISQTLLVLAPKYCYRRFALVRQAQQLRLEPGGVLLEGKSIVKHLADCEEAFVLCATAGLFVDRLIRKTMIIAPEQGVIFNSCGTTAVEQIADLVQEEIRKLAFAEDKQITERFSPGYGDLPLSLQERLLPMVEAHKAIGVSLNESLLMIPEKSVSALIGVKKTGLLSTRECGGHRCQTCNQQKSCLYSHNPKKGRC